MSDSADQEVESFFNAKTQQGIWTFICPITNLQVGSDIGGAFRVEHVTFIQPKKLVRLRQRLKLSVPVPLLRARPGFADVVEGAGSLAIARRRGSGAEVERACRNLVREELAILVASDLAPETAILSTSRHAGRG